MSKPPANFRLLEPVRDRLAEELSNENGVDSVGITKNDGELALSVFLTEGGFQTVALPPSYDGYKVIRKKASEFVPH